MNGNGVFDIFLIFSTLLIWVVLLPTALLSLLGYLYYLEQKKSELKKIPAKRLPSISILIPAHNEEKVIKQTIKTLLESNYPKRLLEIIVINDASTDATGQILKRLAKKHPPLKVVEVPLSKGGRGKAAALNLGLKSCRAPFIAVYDADNRPEPDSLNLLAQALKEDSTLGAVVGKIKKSNGKRNLLVKLSDLEFIAFQWIFQAGRFKLAKLSTLPGTNFLIRKEALKKLGGWDEKALTEDLELTIRLYKEGYQVKFLPQAVTWEQAPEDIRSWIRQRTRWMQGNYYVTLKHLELKSFFKLGWGFPLDLTHFFLVYFLFLLALLASDFLFVFGLWGWFKSGLSGPYLYLWASAFILFVTEMAIGLSPEKKDTPKNLMLVGLMYFTFSQAWLYVALRSLILSIFPGKKKEFWVKTPRYGEGPS